MVVDSVSDVVILTPQQVKPAPAMGTAVDTDYLLGLGMAGQRMLILLDIDRLLSRSDIGLVTKLAAWFAPLGLSYQLIRE